MQCRYREKRARETPCIKWLGIYITIKQNAVTQVFIVCLEKLCQESFITGLRLKPNAPDVTTVMVSFRQIFLTLLLKFCQGRRFMWRCCGVYSGNIRLYILLLPYSSITNCFNYLLSWGQWSTNKSLRFSVDQRPAKSFETCSRHLSSYRHFFSFFQTLIFFHLVIFILVSSSLRVLCFKLDFCKW